MRALLMFIGAVVSGITGFLAFKFSGLCDMCDSVFMQFSLGFLFVVVFLSTYRSGLLNRGRQQN